MPLETKNILANIDARIEESKKPFGSVKAWARCYSLFGDKTESDDHVALQLGYFLACWGMMRGSAFLKGCDYDVHRGAVKILRSGKFDTLRKKQVTAADLTIILDAKLALETHYKGLGLGLDDNDVNVTDTLASKIMLAALGCVPAYDRYFRVGLQVAGITQSFSKRSLAMIIDAVGQSQTLWKEASHRVSLSVGFEVPMMRVIDMHFFSEGKNEEQRRRALLATAAGMPSVTTTRVA